MLLAKSLTPKEAIKKICKIYPPNLKAKILIFSTFLCGARGRDLKRFAPLFNLVRNDDFLLHLKRRFNKLSRHPCENMPVNMAMTVRLA